MSKSIGLLVGILFVGAGATAQTSVSGLTDMREFKDREDCLYREVGRIIKTQGASEDDVAKAATDLCSRTVRARLLRAAPSISDGEEIARYDRLQTELRALAIGRELVEKGQP